MRRFGRAHAAEIRQLGGNTPTTSEYQDWIRQANLKTQAARIESAKHADELFRQGKQQELEAYLAAQKEAHDRTCVSDTVHTLTLARTVIEDQTRAAARLNQDHGRRRSRAAQAREVAEKLFKQP